MEDCSHLNSPEEIEVCINDILGASNCIECVCGVDPFIPGCPAAKH